MDGLPLTGLITCKGPVSIFNFLSPTTIVKNTPITALWLTILLVSSVLLNAVLGDIYLHSPRGSNNRLNEENNNRRNGNRLFDSQNNNAGGYNVGDATNAKAANMDEQYKPELLNWEIVIF